MSLSSANVHYMNRDGFYLDMYFSSHMRDMRLQSATSSFTSNHSQVAHFFYWDGCSLVSMSFPTALSHVACPNICPAIAAYVWLACPPSSKWHWYQCANSAMLATIPTCPSTHHCLQMSGIFTEKIQPHVFMQTQPFWGSDMLPIHPIKHVCFVTFLRLSSIIVLLHQIAYGLRDEGVVGFRGVT